VALKAIRPTQFLMLASATKYHMSWLCNFLSTNFRAELHTYNFTFDWSLRRWHFTAKPRESIKNFNIVIFIPYTYWLTFQLLIKAPREFWRALCFFFTTIDLGNNTTFVSSSVILCLAYPFTTMVYPDHPFYIGCDATAVGLSWTSSEWSYHRCQLASV
jgi:hypothetical protein